MRFLSENNEEFIIRLCEKLAGPTLTKGLARLYSQHTKLQAGKEGLPSWKDGELYLRIGEAERLIVAALSLDNNDLSNRYFRRAAEILEWTAIINPNPSGIPTILLSAAAYQLGGYPARSLGVLSENPVDCKTSKILELFLRGDFRKTQEELLLVFQQQAVLEKKSTDTPSVILDQILRAIGVFTSWIRWGDDERIEVALKIIEDVAKATIYDTDTYSWLLAILVARIARKYKEDAIWEVTFPLAEKMSTDGQKTLSRYSKRAFVENKSLTWPSQREGINGITSGESFALCTPTGSGKTRVAELAILQNLFPFESNIFAEVLPPIVLYLAPSKALSSEVEANLARILSQIKADHISVTSMYGGNDIGPSDVLIAPEQPTVLISTHEKADALIRYLGIELFARISCVIIDEAHTVAFSGNNEELCNAESRSLRLETFVSRLKTICSSDTKFIALSAVASDIQNILSEWTSSIPDKKAISTKYRSTRQLLGKLLCYENGSMEIRYDVLDGQRLILEDREDSPYIRNPFPPHPEVTLAFNEKDGIEKKMRAHLLWAAIHFTISSGKKMHSVLISVPENPGYYASTFLNLLENDWVNKDVPTFFNPPNDKYSNNLMEKCLASCEDYFGIYSLEYQLLKKGIVLHHGKMPLIMSRFLIQLIQSHVVNIVIATSTLSEGVNLPFETILIPNMRRGGSPLSPREVINLMGRAGRPGVSTEGRSLVLLAPNENTGGQYIAKKAYRNLIKILSEYDDSENIDRLHSPLASLIIYIYSQWKAITRNENDEDFIKWLEVVSYKKTDDGEKNLLTAIDTFDQHLLSAIEEKEQINRMDDLERFLQSLWRNTFSYHDSKRELIFEKIFTQRGLTLANSIYPDRSKRSQIYYTGLPPRDAIAMLEVLEDIKAVILKASDYLCWEEEQKVNYFIEIVTILSRVDSFCIPNLKKPSVAWQDILKWWLASGVATKKPNGTNVSVWYEFSAKHFVYKLNWAVGSAIGSILHKDGGEGTILQQWSQAKLPWIAIWFKDLINWGVLDPVASFVMAKKQAFTRKDAKIKANEYWCAMTEDLSDSMLEPKKIYKWLNKICKEDQNKDKKKDIVPNVGYEVSVDLLDDFTIKPLSSWKVFPADHDKEILWLDPAGFPLAKSKKPVNWNYSSSSLIDFILKPYELQVIAHNYI